MSLLVAGLCSNARRHPEFGYVGDPTETALLEFAERAGAPLEQYERTGEIPFTSERQMMSVAVKRSGEEEGLLLAKGALEAVLPLCTSIRTPDGVSALSDEKRNALLEQNVGLAGQALRVLAFAYKEQPADAPMIEVGLTFAALGAMSDPPRPEATHAIEAPHRAGIRVVMITGDNSLTAAAMGREVGLDGEAIEAKELDALDEAELKRVVNETSIFARAEPRHKVLILRTLKEYHDVVLMTGDGVNDAPALRNADVGVAMGIKGTDVARDTSDMVLLDDNLATIIAAVEEGRRIFRNIKPRHGLRPGGRAGVGPGAAGSDARAPRHGAVLGRSMAALVGSIGVIKALILLGTFFIGLQLWDLETARTMTFTGFVVQEYLRLVVIRVQEGMPICTNKWLWAAVSFSLFMQAIIVYTPIGSAAFDTVALGPEQWGILLAGLVVGFAVAIVTGKLVVRRFGPL